MESSLECLSEGSSLHHVTSAEAGTFHLPHCDSHGQRQSFRVAALPLLALEKAPDMHVAISFELLFCLACCISRDRNNSEGAKGNLFILFFFN